jgi:hypothetical protein
VFMVRSASTDRSRVVVRKEREVRNSEGQQFLSEAVAWIEFCRAVPATCASAVGWFLLAWDKQTRVTA